MKSIVQQLREEKKLTKSEHAEKTELSLTIQRIEAGNIQKGFTLKILSSIFEAKPEKLIPSKEIVTIDRAKLS